MTWNYAVKEIKNKFGQTFRKSKYNFMNTDYLEFGKYLKETN